MYKFRITEMDETLALIISEWKYEGKYSIYSFSDDLDYEFEQVTSGYYLPVLFDEKSEENKIIPDFLSVKPAGFLAVGPAAQVITSETAPIYEDESFTDMAIGMNPIICGRKMGIGEAFVNACVGFLEEEFPGDTVRLTVLRDNERAIKVYERCGFSKTFEFKGPDQKEYQIMCKKQ